MNEIIHMEPSKAVVSDRNIRIHDPMPLHNPFKATERISLAECFFAYEGWLRNRLASGDKLIVAEMERIAELVTDKTEKPVGLIGEREVALIIAAIIAEALNQ